MYVRWKTRKMTSFLARGKTALTAVLVESCRVDGRPRQRHVCYLGTVVEELATHPFRQSGFWATAERHLDALNLDPLTRERIETALLAKVPRPDDAVLAGERARLARLEAGIRRAL